MRIEGAHAFVLHARRWRETSLLVEVLSLEHGRLGLAARGVATAKRHRLRAALQPLQQIRFNAVLRGELATLTHVETLDPLPRLNGPALLSGFYVNELILRLLARQDPHPELYVALADVRTRLGNGESASWSLRRFERDLLQAVGWGLDYRHDADGRVIDPAARYRLDPEQGACRIRHHHRADARGGTVSGHALNALAHDMMPSTTDLADLRRAMRQVLTRHLGPRGLKSWELVSTLRPLVTWHGTTSGQ